MLAYWPMSWDYTFCAQDACPKADTCMRAIGRKFLQEDGYYTMVQPEEKPCGLYWDSAPFEAKQEDE